MEIILVFPRYDDIVRVCEKITQACNGLFTVSLRIQLVSGNHTNQSTLYKSAELWLPVGPYYA